MSLRIYDDSGAMTFDSDRLIRRDELTSIVSGFDTRMESLSAELEAIRLLLKDPSPPDPPVLTGIILSPTDSIQDAIRDAKNGQDILLRAGTYRQKAKFLQSKPGLHLKPYPGDEGKVIVDGRKPFDAMWTNPGSGVLSTRWPGMPDLWHFTAGGDPRLPAGDRQKHYPVLATIGDTKLKFATSPSLAPGQFWIDSAANAEGTIYVYPAAGQDITGLQVSPFPYLIAGEDNCIGIHISDITFQYCSGTGKDGMVSTPGAEWRLTNVIAKWADSIGIEMGGQLGNTLRSTAIKHTFTNCLSSYAGQLSWWGSGKECMFIDCEGSFSNQDDYYLWWEAGHKFEMCTDCEFINWRSVGNKAHGFWFDIGNTNNEMMGGYFENNMGSAITVEHYSSGNAFYDITINNTRPKADLKAGHGVLMGLYLLSSANNNTFDRGKVINCEDGVRFNTKDPRSPACKDNTVLNYEFVNCTNNKRIDGPDDGTNRVI